MAYQNNHRRYQVDIGFNVDPKGIKLLQQELKKLEFLKDSDYSKLFDSTSGKYKEEAKKMRIYASEVRMALQAAYNPKLKTVNIEKFNRIIKQSGLNLSELSKYFSNVGVAGQNVSALLTNSMTKFNVKIKESHKLLDKMGKTLANTLKWNLSATLINNVSGSIQQAWGFTKNLQQSLTNIRMVTGKNADEMKRFAQEANKAAFQLGRTTTDYTKASLIYAQQGLSDAEIKKRSEITLKTANVTGQSTEAVSEELTAVWNGYKVSAAEAEIYIDRLAAVASTTASNLSELSTGMSKVAAAAASLGVGEEQLAAQLSTIISVTRQAPETVGTALKTIYSRISDIQAGIDEDGTTLGTYSGKLAALGIKVLDASGKLRNMGQVMEEIGSKWGTFSKEQQTYIAQTMAGQRQYTNLIALFDNYQDKYISALKTAQGAEGTLNKQNKAYMEDINTKINQMTAATEKMWMNLIDTDGFKGVIGDLTKIINKVDQLFQSIGGGKAVLNSIGVIATQLMSKTMASGINTFINNRVQSKEQKASLKQAQTDIQDKIAVLEAQGKGDSTEAKTLRDKARFLPNMQHFSNQSISKINQLWDQSTNAGIQADIAKKQKEEKFDPLKKLAGIKEADESNLQGIQANIEAANEVFKADQDAATQIIKNSASNIFQVQTEEIKNATEAVNNANKIYEDAIAKAEEAKEKLQNYTNKKNERDAAKQAYDDLNQKNQDIKADNKKKRITLKQDIDKKEQQIQNKVEQLNGMILYEGGGYRLKENVTDQDYKNLQDEIQALKQEKNTLLDQLNNLPKPISSKVNKARKALQKAQNTFQEERINNRTPKADVTKAKNKVEEERQNVDQAERDRIKAIGASRLEAFNNSFSGTIKDKEGKEQQYDLMKYIKAGQQQGASDELKEFAQQYKQLTKEIEESGNASAEEIQELDERVKSFFNALNQYAKQSAGNLESEGQNAMEALQKQKQALKKAKQAAEEAKSGMRQATIQGALQLAGALSQVQASMQNIRNLGSIWSDENLSDSEKISQTLSNLLVSLPMLITGFVSASGSIKKVSSAIGVYKTKLTEQIAAEQAVAQAQKNKVAMQHAAQASKQARTAAINANTTAIQTNTAAAEANAVATETNITATQAETAVKEASTVATETNTVAQEANVAMDAADTVAETTNTVAEAANTAAQSANTGSTVANTAAEGAHTTTEIADTAATDAHTVAIEAESAALNKNTKSTQINVKAMGKRLLTNLADTAKTVVKTIGSICSKLASSIGGVGAAALGALAVLAVVAKVITDINDKQAQAAVEANKKIITSENEKQETIKKERDIIAEVEALNKAYEQGSITKTELKQKTLQLQQTYKKESADIQQLIADYHNLGEAAIEAKKKEAQKTVESTKKERKAADIALNKKLQTMRVGTNFANWTGAVSGGIAGQATIGVGAGGNEGYSAQRLTQILGDDLAYYYAFGQNTVKLKKGDSQTSFRQLEAMQRYVDTASQEEQKTDIYAGVVQILTEMEEEIKQYKQARTEEQQAYANQQFLKQDYKNRFNNVNNLTEFLQEQKQLFYSVSAIQAQNGYTGLSDSEIDELVDKVITQNVSKEIQDKYLNKVEFYNNLNYEWQTSEVSDLLNDMTQEQLAYLKSIDPTSYVSSYKNIFKLLKDTSELDFSRMNTSAKEAATSAKKWEDYAQKTEKGQKFSSDDISKMQQAYNENKEGEAATGLSWEDFRKTYFYQDEYGDFYAANINDTSNILREIKSINYNKNVNNLQQQKNLKESWSKQSVNDLGEFINLGNNNSSTDIDEFKNNFKYKGAAKLADDGHGSGSLEWSVRGQGRDAIAPGIQIKGQQVTTQSTTDNLYGIKSISDFWEEIEDVVPLLPQEDQDAIYTLFRQERQAATAAIQWAYDNNWDNTKYNEWAKESFPAFVENVTSKIKQGISNRENSFETQTAMLNKTLNQLDQLDLNEKDKLTLKSLKAEADSIKDGDFEQLGVMFDKIQTFENEIKSNVNKINSNINQDLEESINKAYRSYNPIDSDIDSTHLNLFTNEISKASIESEIFSENLQSNREDAESAAESIDRYSIGLEKIINNYSDWNTKLSSNNLSEIATILPDIKNAYGDLFNINSAFISDDFALSTENLSLFYDVMMGVEGSYQKLSKKIKTSFIKSFDVSNEIETKLNKIQDIVDLTTIEIGAEIDDKDLINQIETILANTEITEEQMMAYLELLGMKATIVNGKVYQITKSADQTTKQLYKSQSVLDSIAQKQRDIINNHKELNKYLEDERDLYHDINREIAKMDRTLSRLETTQQGLTGVELYNNLTQQNAALNEKSNKLKTKSSLQEQDLVQSRTKLSSKYGVTFSSNGEISNYLDILASYENQVNATIAKKNRIINSMNAWTDNGGNTSDNYYSDLQTALTQAENDYNHINDKYSSLKSDLSAYDSLLDQHEETIDQQTQALRKQIAINIQKFDLKVSLQLDLTEAKKNWEEFKKNVLNRDDILNPDTIGSKEKDVNQAKVNYGNRMEDAQKITSSIDQVLTEIDNFNRAGANGETYQSNLFNSVSQAYTKLTELQEKGEQALEDAAKYADIIKQAYLDAFSYVQEEFDKQNNYYSFISQQLSHDVSLMDLIYGSRGGRYKDNYYNQMNNFGLDQIDMLKQQQQFWAEQEAAATDEAAKKIAHENWENVTKSLNSTTKQAIQNLKSQFKNMIDTIVNELENSLTNGHGFDYITLEWDILKGHADIYLDTVNSAFAIKNTQYLFNKAISDTSELRNQQALKKVMQQQMQILKEKDKLTQYDVDRAEKVLEVEKARIALEEARNNKTTMRLKRDASGNYSYQFTADEEAIDQAQNDLYKAQNDLYNFDLQAWHSNNEKAVAVFKDAINQIAEIRKNDNLSEQQKQERIALIQKDTQEKMTFYAQENNFIRTNLEQSTYDSMIDLMNSSEINYRDMIQGMNSESQNFIDKFNSNPDSVMNMFNEAIQSMEDKSEEYNIQIENVVKTAKGNFEELKEATDPIVENEAAMVTKNDELIDSMDKTISKVSGWVGSLSIIESNWQGVYDQTENALTKAQEYVRYWNEHFLGKTQDETENNGSSNQGDGKKGGNGNYINPGEKGMEGLFAKLSPTPTSDSNSFVTPTFNRNIKKEQTLDADAIADKTAADTAYSKQKERGERREAKIEKIANETAAHTAIYKQRKRLLKDLDNIPGYNRSSDYFRTRWFDTTGTLKITPENDQKWSKDELQRLKNMIVATYRFKTIVKNQKDFTLKGPMAYQLQDYINKYNNQNDSPEDFFWNTINNNERMNMQGLITGAIDKNQINDIDKIIKEQKMFDFDNFDKVINATTYDTGGYTGNWNSSDGRLAVLHEKELVLNKNDTVNMLKIVQASRNIIDMVQNNVLSVLSSQIQQLNSTWDSTKAQVNKYNQETVNNRLDTQKLNQQVSIEANFPNVTNKTEIQEAFSDLVNLATQKALNYNKN